MSVLADAKLSVTAKLLQGNLIMADAAAGVLDHAGDESFTLTFNQIVSRVKLIRAGGEEEAINRPLRTMDRSKYEKIPKKRR